MFIFDSNYIFNLADYGILVPISKSKRELFYEYLISNFSNEYFAKPHSAQLVRDNLHLVHNEEFTTLVKEFPDKNILHAFELIKSDGSYHRYNPKNAKFDLRDLSERLLTKCGGTIKACEIALNKGFAYNLGGGGHHAMTYESRGFCIINDIVLSARYLQKKLNLKNIWVIDVDCHKGDGTAQITKDDKSINTFSIHMQKGWPLDSKRTNKLGEMYPWFIPSDLDIEVPENGNYLKLLKDGLNVFTKKFSRPDLAIVVHGSDPYEKDSLQSASLIKLTREQMTQRDHIVYQILKNNNIPQAYVMAGGYGPHAHEPYIDFINSIKSDII